MMSVIGDGTRPRVSVVIPAYNSGKLLGQTLESVLNQSFRDLEVILVDDGSTDDTTRVADAFGPPVRVVRQRNQGPSAARNHGVEVARGPFIAFLDADDLWLPDKLRLQMELFDRRPELGLVYTNYQYTDGSKLLPLHRSAQKKPYEGWVFRQLLRDNFVATSTAVLRRECFRQVGGFDPKLRISEDYDLWLRIARKFEMGYAPPPLARYRFHGRNVFGNLEERLDSRRYIFRKLARETPAELLPDPEEVHELTARYHFHIGRLYLRNGEPEKARELFRSLQGRRTPVPGLGTWLLGTWIPPWLLRAIRGWRGRTGPAPECAEVLRAVASVVEEPTS
jgi:glycosyltransferase involved in cell wall biosynthesis